MHSILAQANDEDKNEYISLLWRDGTVPRSIKKYCLRKKMYLKPVERLLEVNRECEARLKKGEDPLLVAEYYTKEKEKLQKEQLEYERQFRSWMREDRRDIKQMKQDAKLEKKENSAAGKTETVVNTNKETQMQSKTQTASSDVKQAGSVKTTKTSNTTKTTGTAKTSTTKTTTKPKTTTQKTTTKKDS